MIPLVVLPLLALNAVSDSCLEPKGSRITAGDLATASSAMKQLPADLDLGYAPKAGFVRNFTQAELRQWLQRRGADSAVDEGVCVRWALHELRPEEARGAMLSVLPPGSELLVLETSQYGVPRGDLVFPRSGLRAGVWKGYVQYAKDLRHDVWARVDVRIPWRRVLATTDLRPGVPIGQDAVRVATGVGMPESVPYAEEVEDVVGRSPRQAIAAGAPVPRMALTKRNAVRKGDTVHVNVLAGGATLRFDGTAEASAAEGEIVPVRLPDSGRVLRPRMAAQGQALLDLNGGNSR